MADIKVNLAFTADTKQAQASIQQLQQSLLQISASGMKGSMSKEMEQASAAAKELSYHLNQAFNAKTGNFDLSRLDRSLKSAGTNVEILSTKLLGAGQTGQQAFIQLAQSISLADRPMITLSTRLQGLFTTLKNTAKWQISSTILHGFMGAVQQAYGYAQDLNKSLNNIRIVTGYNTDQMAKFAEAANKSAKALSTTTTAYTDASLIYYQQGLDDDAVKKRTDVTIKLANVSRQSAEEVSSQMTAIWNNFDDGTKSLEYYADAITALGAKTASSSAEIAEGLQKFAAVSDTVGLSYEYATAALATVVAQTRQSADTVGTAFKTMFARIEGLKLGETLEDGTTFNQYSEALATIGVNIKDANGELRNMDDILDDMGARWKELNRDEQVAVAQKVAGVRQYQQMIALMDNYDVFKGNVDIASDASGTLQKQADIYAESWEAAQKRVKASAEQLYDDLLNDSFFIKLNDALSGLLDSIDAFIDSMGGIGPLLTGIGSILLGIFAHKLPGVINNLKANFNILFKGAANQARELATSMKNMSESLLSSDGGKGLSEQNRVLLQNTVDLTGAKNQLSAVSAKMTDQERAAANAELSLIQAQQKEIVILAEKVDKRRNSIQELQNAFDTEKAVAEAGLDFEEKELELIEKKRIAQETFLNNRNPDNRKAYTEAIDDLNSYRNHIEETTGTFRQYSTALYDAYVNALKLNNGQTQGVEATIKAGEAFEQYIVSLKNMEQGILESGNAPGIITQTTNTLQLLQEDLEQIVGKDLPKVDDAFERAFQATSPKALKQAIQDIIKELEATNIPAEKLEKILIRFGQGANIKKLKTEFRTLGQELTDLKNKQEQVNKMLGSFNPNHVITGVERMASAASGLGALAMGISSVRSAIEALNNEDLSFGEKLTTIFMSISMLAGSVKGALTGFNTALGGIGSMAGSMTIALSKIPDIMKNVEITTMLAGAATEIKNGKDKEMIANSLAKAAVAKGVIAAEEEQAFATSALTALEKLEAAATEEEIAAALTEMMQSFLSASAKAGETTSRLGHVAALYAEAAAYIAAHTALSPLLALTLLFVATLGGIAAVIAGVVFGIKSMIDNIHTYSEKTQEAQERTKLFKSQLDEAKTSAQNLKTTISNWDEAIDNLKEMDKHTEEYVNKLREANEQARELIDTYNLYNQYTIDDGVIKISQEALEKIQREADNKVRKSENNVYVSQIGENQATKAEKANNLMKKMPGYYGSSQKQKDLDSVVSALQEFYKNPPEVEMVKANGEVVKHLQSIEDFLKTSDKIPNSIKEAIQNSGDDFIKELIDYESNSNQKSNAIDYSSFQLKQNLIRDKYDSEISSRAIDGSGQVDYAKKEDLINILTKIQSTADAKNEYNLSETLKAIDDRVDKTLYSNKDLRLTHGFDIDNDEDLARVYAEKVVGLSKEDAQKATYDKGTGKGSLKLNQKEIFSNIDDQTMRRDLVRQEMKSKVEQDYSDNQISDNILKSLDRISTVGIKYGQKIGADLNQALLDSFANSSNKIDFSEIFADLNESEVTDLLKIANSPDDLLKQLGIKKEDLQSLGYDSAKEFAEAFSKGLSSWNPEDAAASFKEKLQAATSANAEEFDLDPDMVYETAEAFVEAGKAGEEMYASLANNAEEAAQVAKTYIRVNNAVLDLSENYDDYAKVLGDIQKSQDKADKAMQANTKTGKALRTSLAGLLDVSEDLIDADLLDAIDPKDFDAASKGDAAAIERIRTELLKLQAEAYKVDFTKLKNEIDGLTDEEHPIKFGADTTELLWGIIQAKVNAGAGAEEIQELLSDFNLTADVTDFNNAMEAAKQKSSDTAQNIVADQTYNAEVDSASIDTETQGIDYSVDQEVHQEGVPGTVTTWVVSEGDGASTPIPITYDTSYPRYTKTSTVKPVVAEGTETTAATSQKMSNAKGTSANNYKGVTIDNIRKKSGGTVSPVTRDTAGKNRSGGSKGGGGGGRGSSSPAKKERGPKRSDTVDRYKKIEDRLKIVNKNLDKYNTLADAAFGQGKEKAMKNIIKLYDQQIKLQTKLIGEAEQYKKEDKKNLEQAANDLNVKIKYDKDGNISNIETIEQKIWLKLNSLYDQYNSFSTSEEQSKFKESTLSPYEEKVSYFKEMVSQYDDTLDKINEATQAKLELEIERMSKALESLNYKIKLKVEIRTDEIERFEKELEKLEDTAFSATKQLAYFRAEIKALRDITKTSKKGVKNTLKTSIYKEEGKTQIGKRAKTDSNGNIIYDQNGNPIMEDYKYKETITLDQYMKDLGWDKDKRDDAYNKIMNGQSPFKSYKSLTDFFKDWNITEEGEEELKEFLDTLEEANDALDELKEKVDSSIINTFDHWQRVMDNLLDQMEHYTNLSQTWLDIIERIAGRAGMSSEDKRNLRQTNFETKVNEVGAVWDDYKMVAGQYEASKDAFKAMASQKSAEEEAAKKRIEEIDKQIGNRSGRDYQNHKTSDQAFANATGYRATLEKVEDKLKHPEKYYGSANYFETKEGKAEYERLKEKEQKYTDKINELKGERSEQEILMKEAHFAAQQAIDDQNTMIAKMNELKEQGITGLAELLELADELYNQTFEDIINDFEKKMSGLYGSFAEMADVFDKNQEISERYLADYEKIYELTKLNRDLEKKMDETSNIRAKQKLRDLQKQITQYAEEGVKMSKYDLEYMQKQYDLEVAKIALEEAQNAKTQVRLTRDSEGNYSYTYTADESKTADAEQKYEDVLNDLMKLNDSYQMETQKSILDAQQKYTDELNDLNSRRLDMTEEEFKARLQQINAYYASQMDYFSRENEKASHNATTSFVLEYDSYYGNTEKKINVSRWFTDEERANYAKVAEIYREAAIQRDKEAAFEETAYKRQQDLILELYQEKLDRLEIKYQEGNITEEEYLRQKEEIEKQKYIELNNAAVGHITYLNGVNDQYHKDLAEDVELDNGLRQSASDYWQDLMQKDTTANGEYKGQIAEGNAGFIANTQKEFLPGLSDIYDDAGGYVEDFANSITDGTDDANSNTLMGNINAALDQNAKNTAIAMGAVDIATDSGETAYTDLASTATDNINEINTSSTELGSTVAGLAADGIQDMEEMGNAVVNWYNKSYPSWQNAKNDIDAVTASINGLISAAAGIEPINIEVNTNTNTNTSGNKTTTSGSKTTTNGNTTTTGGSKTTTSGSKTTTSGNKTTTTTTTTPTTTTQDKDTGSKINDSNRDRVMKEVAMAVWYKGTWGLGRTKGTERYDKLVSVFGKKGQKAIQDYLDSDSKNNYKNVTALKNKYDKEGTLDSVLKKWSWSNMSKYADTGKFAFNTGGYTGKWGQDGRWAILHEKELVLNKEDTENMLAAVKTVREIAAMVDLQAQSASLAGQYALKLQNLEMAKNQQLDQNVHITAEFPNVQDHNEVELALTSLVNRASQFAWRQ